jgi:hypothetical protein
MNPSPNSGATARNAPPSRSNDHVVTTRSGAEIHRGANGQVREVHAHGMVISHNPGGSRMVTSERPGHVVVISNHYGHGYFSAPIFTVESSSIS